MKQIILVLILLIIPLAYTERIVEVCYNQTISDVENECKINLSIETDKNYYNNKEKISFYNNLTPKNNNFIIEYWIENSTGSIIKEKLNTTNLNQKSFTPYLKSSDTLKIKNKLIQIDCNNTSNITYSEKEVFVYVYKDSKPFFEIIEIYLNKNKTVKLNESIKTKINIYTGNLSNQTLEIKIENVTSQLESLSSPYQKYNLTLYTKIPDNCSIASGQYILKYLAFNKEIIEGIYLLNNCKEINPVTTMPETPTNTTQELEDNYFPENNINLTEAPITGNVVYESSSIKSRKIVIYLIAGIIIMALIYLVPNKLIVKTTS